MDKVHRLYSSTLRAHSDVSQLEKCIRRWRKYRSAQLASWEGPLPSTLFVLTTDLWCKSIDESELSKWLSLCKCQQVPPSALLYFHSDGIPPFTVHVDKCVPCVTRMARLFKTEPAVLFATVASPAIVGMVLSLSSSVLPHSVALKIFHYILLLLVLLFPSWCEDA